MTDIPKPKLTPAQIFRALADRIERNDPTEFAGAYLIISPSGSVLSHTFIDPKGDESQFWGHINGAVTIAGAEAVQKEEEAIRMFGQRMPRR